MNAWNVNSPALSKQIFYIGWSGNYACNLIIWVSILANAVFLVESRQTCDHLVDASINSIKYLNGPQGGCIGPQIYPWILSKKDGDSIPIFDGDGLIINFPWEQALHE